MIRLELTSPIKTKSLSAKEKQFIKRKLSLLRLFFKNPQKPVLCVRTPRYEVLLIFEGKDSGPRDKRTLPYGLALQRNSGVLEFMSLVRVMENRDYFPLKKELEKCGTLAYLRAEEK